MSKIVITTKITGPTKKPACYHKALKLGDPCKRCYYISDCIAWSHNNIIKHRAETVLLTRTGEVVDNL